MRWVKVGSGGFVNLDHVCSVELGREVDFTQPAPADGTGRPMRTVLGLYFPLEVDHTQVSVGVTNPDTIKEITDILEVMCRDTYQDNLPPRRKRPGIIRKDEPIESDTPADLSQVATPRTGRGSQLRNRQ